MKLSVPESLKALLVDDWEAVTKNSQVCGLLSFLCENLDSPLMKLTNVWFSFGDFT